MVQHGLPLVLLGFSYVGPGYTVATSVCRICFWRRSLGWRQAVPTAPQYTYHLEPVIFTTSSDMQLSRKNRLPKYIHRREPRGPYGAHTYNEVSLIGRSPSKFSWQFWHLLLYPGSATMVSLQAGFDF